MNILPIFNIAAAFTFNQSAAKDLVTSISNPLTLFLIWAVPITTAIVCIKDVIVYQIADEDEKERKKPMPKIKKNIFWGMIGVAITTILAIFGL